MSLFALPVTVSDLRNCKLESSFSPTLLRQPRKRRQSMLPKQLKPSTPMRHTDSSNISLSQVAMADTAIMEGGTIAVGDTTTPNTLTFLSTEFLPAQVAKALRMDLIRRCMPRKRSGLALGQYGGFNTNFAGLSTSAFVPAVANATGVNATAIQGFLNNWIAFYTANLNARPGLSVTQAAYGATFGDSIGVALLNPTAANLQTVVSTTPNVNAFTPNTIAGLVANALIDNAEGTYKTGVSLAALPPHTPLQGEAGSGANGVSSPRVSTARPRASLETAPLERRCSMASRRLTRVRIPMLSRLSARSALETTRSPRATTSRITRP